ncbi:MAG TPA: tetratricopeptide repeat protein [Chthoniobacterales bacterium]|nr:tetratricopeptide repeat protein [Chthoniobacterales bacterium]
MAAITFAVYGQVVRHDFIQLDDNQYITNNPIVAHGLSWAGLGWAFTSFHAANWHPLTWLSHMLDCQLFGLHAGPHLLVNVGLHTANTLLVYWVFRRSTGAFWSSAIVAALFALHPLHIESVAWASERKDVLSALFGLLCLLGYVRYVERPSPGRYALVALALACGLMAKSMLVTWPFVLLLFDVWPLRRFHWPDDKRPGKFFRAAWPLLREKLPLLPLVLASAVLTMLSQSRGGAFHALADAPFFLRLSNALVAYAKYVGAIFWPHDLAPFYPFPLGGLPLWQVLAATVLLVLVTLAAVLAARAYPYFTTGWFWFLGTLVPVIGLVQVGGQAMADRYTYLPSIGLFFACVFGLADIAARFRLGRVWLGGIAVAILVCASTLSARQLTYWRDSETLFRRTLAVTSENPVIEYNLGCVLGQTGRYQEALEHFDVLLRVQPDSVDGLLSKGAALLALGRRSEGSSYLARATEVAPDSLDAHSRYAMALIEQGNASAALAEFRRARELAPADVAARTNLGVMLSRLDRMREAEIELTEAVRLDPANAEAQSGLGLVLLATGRARESVPHLLRALELKPDISGVRQNLERAEAMIATGQ